MNSKFKRVAAGVAAVAAASTVVIAASPAAVSALPAGTGPDGLLNISPSVGDSNTDFSLVYANTAGDIYCSGDSATDGYRWGGFLIPAAEDAALVTFSPTGFPGGVTGALPLVTANGGPVGPQNTAITTGFANVASITLDLDNGAYAGLNGEYQIGYACWDTGTPQPYEITDYWVSTMTVTPQAGAGTNNFVYAQGVAPAAPAGVTASAVDGIATVSWTTDTNDDSYTVTVSGGDLGAPIVVNNASPGVTVPGLTNGVTYDATVTAVKAGFTSASSAPVSFTSTATPQPGVTGLTATPVPGGDIDVSWTAPAGETATRNGYTVSYDDGAGSSGSVTLPATATSTTLTGLTVGSSYVITVVATYPSPDAGTPVSVASTSQPNAVLEQTITVQRPEGALLFTQRCGVNDQLEAVAAGVVPGFWDGLGEILSSGDQTGNAPILLPGTAADPNFGEYPYPIDEATGIPNPNYTTQCGIDLGRAELVTQQDDPFRGTFFRADGLIDQITVVDTTNGDAGWTLTGTMSAFSDGGSNTFTGNYLGWAPELNFVSAADPISGYQIAPAAGAPVGAASAPGLAAGATLGSAPSGQGLGIAEFDARLLLLIPLSADAATYTGTMTYTLA